LARKILLADDSVTAQNMGRKILADAGYDVVTVNNGSAALKRITEVKPDLIVLDVYMPGYSGLEVCQRLKDAAETAHIPVLLTVGKLEPFKPEEARRVRADAHIVKPFEASELLTAITRLEDRMVPQQSDGRFSTSVSGVERFGGEAGGRKSESDADADTGWKSRLRFPSKKKKEPEPEPEPEEVAESATFRDFRKGKSKAGGNAITVKTPAPPGQEPGLVPDIPRDITPEELDALSALAAKLDGPIPEAENIAPLAEKPGPVETPAIELTAPKTEVQQEVQQPEVAKAEPDAPVVAAQSAIQSEEQSEEKKEEVETPAAVAEPASAVEVPAAVEVGVASVEAKHEVEIPVAHVEPADEVAAPAVKSAVVEIDQPAAVTETQTPETTAAAETVSVNALAQESSPGDKNDEPTFTAAASTVEPSTGSGIEAKLVEAIAQSNATETSVPTETVGAAEDLEPEQPAPLAASAPQPSQLEEPAPSDEELAEALRLLTPSTGHADTSTTVPSHGTLVAAGQLLAEEAARNAAVGPRWVAEPVKLSPEEAAISLEAEMFRTFATAPAAISETLSRDEIGPERVTGVSAIAAAVENRLAEAGLTPSAKAVADQRPERLSSEHFSNEYPSGTTSVETFAAETTADVSTVPVVSSPAADGNGAEKSALVKLEPEQVEAEQKEGAAKVSEEPTAGEVAAATFADAMAKQAVEAPAEQIGEPAGAILAAAASSTEAIQESSPDSGGEDVKSKSGKSNWHQIRTAPASSAANTDVVEAAKQAEAAAAAPKAMAAAAAADGSSSSSTSATDASTIASIVDSVMADLRPKIVEEIAKKLAGK
jgi:CheY-like chemotaxis protein